MVSEISTCRVLTPEKANEKRKLATRLLSGNAALCLLDKGRS